MLETLWEIVSLNEFVILVVFLLVTVIQFNTYTAAIIGMYVVKQLVEKVIKSKYGNEGIGKRPEDARDCNMINKGGYSAFKPGFPSGHTTVIFMITTILGIEYLKLTNYEFNKQPPIVLYLVIGLAFLTPIARMRLQCHTFLQVFAGALLGIVLGVGYGYGIDAVLSKFDRYKQDKNSFLESIGFPVNEGTTKV